MAKDVARCRANMYSPETEISLNKNVSSNFLTFAQQS